jgi:hypothetical protein
MREGLLSFVLVALAGCGGGGAKYHVDDQSLDTAKLNQKTAEASGDVNRKTQSVHDVKVAEVGVKAADTKVDWLNKKRKWFKAQRDAADDHFAAADSRLELEKAKLAQQKNIKPGADFSVGDYESQWKDKNGDWESAKKDAESEQKKATDREQKWKDLVAQHQKLRG